MRLRILLSLSLLAGLAAAAVLLTRPGHELTGEFGLRADPAFTAILSGKLFDARTIRDGEGAPDVGYLTADATLSAVVTATDRGGVARVQLLIDGHVEDTRALPCPGQRCSRRAQVLFRPRVLAAGLGPHRVVVAAGSRAGVMVRAASFTVNVGARSAAPLEIEARAAVPRPVGPASKPSAVDRIVRAAAGRGPLARLIGRSSLRLRERGTTGPRVVSVLADVRPTRLGVTAVLPQAGDVGAARMHARALSDLVIDVDMTHRRVIGLQPGPASQVSSWTLPAATSHEDDEAPSTRFTPRRAPRLLQLSDGGSSFFTQDGDPVLRADGRDWPVSFLFTGHATVAKVKAGLRRLGLTRRGHTRFLGYHTPGGALRFDSDRGLKGACDANATDVHARVYAPTRTDRFLDPDLGSVVVATVHLDHVDGCGAGPPLFGFSERAERRLASMIRVGLHWRVRVGAYPLGNAEPLRRDRADSSHVWLSDGLATGVVVP